MSAPDIVRVRSLTLFAIVTRAKIALRLLIWNEIGITKSAHVHLTTSKQRTKHPG